MWPASGFVEVAHEQPLRDSVLWRLQDAFYREMGARSWSAAIVPNFVTSNSYIAKSYASVLLGLVEDWLGNRYAPARPDPGLGCHGC